METVADSKTVCVRRKFEDWQFEERDWRDLGRHYDTFEDRNKPSPVKTAPIFGDRQDAVRRFDINERNQHRVRTTSGTPSSLG